MDLEGRLREESVEARVAGRLDDAVAIELFCDLLQATRHEPRHRELGGPEPMRQWILRAAVAHGVMPHDPDDHAKVCHCERCPHCGEVLDE